MLSLKKVMRLVRFLMLRVVKQLQLLPVCLQVSLELLLVDLSQVSLVLLVKKYVKVPRSLEGAKSILLLPLLGTILTGFVMLAVKYPNGSNQHWHEQFLCWS